MFWRSPFDPLVVQADHLVCQLPFHGGVLACGREDLDAIAILIRRLEHAAGSKQLYDTPTARPAALHNGRPASYVVPSASLPAPKITPEVGCSSCRGWMLELLLPRVLNLNFYQVLV